MTRASQYCEAFCDKRRKNLNDILYNSAIKYKNMLNKEYNIVVGRKCKEYKIYLRFTKDTYFHLAGLQHLTDLTFPSKNKERIYKEILQKNITIETLKKSVFYDEYYIEERITNLEKLEEMLDSCQFVFLINHNEYIKYTRIYADYLCEHILSENEKGKLYFFVVKMRNPSIEDECRGCSFFKKHEKDYRKGTSGTKLLLNQKYIDRDKETEQKIELFRHPNYEKY